MRKLQRPLGFSLIELMIGMALGLLCTLVIATVLGNAEGNRRGTTSGSDAQIAGNLSLFTLQTEMAMAGYGFASESPAIGCPLRARFGGKAVAALPPNLVPIVITPGASDTASDSIRVIASSKMVDGDPAKLSTIGYTTPQRLVQTYYTPGAQEFRVRSVLSYARGDLVVMVVNEGLDCEMFQINGAPVAVPAPTLPRLDEASGWNDVGFPTQTAQEPCLTALDCPGKPVNATGSFVVNLGRVVDRIYSVADGQLQVSELDTSTLTRTLRNIQGGIVMVKAYYGHDTNGDGAVDTYNKTSPTTQAGWRNVLSARIVVVARSGQFEKEAVTSGKLQWRVGTAAATEGAVSCGSTSCVELDLSAIPEWQHYRYRTFDTVVPLRNQRMKSRAPT